MLLRKFWSGCLKQCKTKSALFNLLTSSLRTTKFRFHYPEHQFHRLQILTIFIYLVCRQIHVREISRQSVLCSISGNLFVVDGYFDFILHVKELVVTDFVENPIQYQLFTIYEDVLCVWKKHLKILCLFSLGFRFFLILIPNPVRENVLTDISLSTLCWT